MRIRHAALALCLLAMGGFEARAAGEQGDGEYRVVVADAKAPTLRVINLRNGTLLGSYGLAGPARLHLGASGRYIYAMQEKHDQVAVFDSGIVLESHGDHSDLVVAKPRLLPVRIDGPKPAHVNRGGDLVAIFFDGDGAARMFREQDLVEDRSGTIRRIESGARHHGVAKPVGRHVAITVPPPDDGLPNAIELRAADGKASSRLDCPRLHGEGATGRFVAFGCADGLAVYEVRRDAIVARRIAYPESSHGSRMIRNMAGATGFSFIAGDFGADGMVIFDQSSGEGRVLELPGRRMHFQLHPEPGDRLYVLIEDGTLLAINPMTGMIEARVRATDRYSMEPGVVRPRVTSAGPYAVVSDPAAGEIVILNAQTLKGQQRVKIGGAPFDLLAVGGSGSTH